VLSDAETLTELLIAAVVSLGGLVLAYIVISKGIEYLASYLPGTDPQTIRSVFRRPVVGTAFLFIVWVFLQPLPIPAQAQPVVTPGFWTVGVLLWLPGFLRAGRIGIKAAVKTEQLEQTVAPIVQNIWTIVILLSGAGVLMSIWGIEITPLLASAGVLGIVLGFAARETIANFLASLSLYADDTYQKGDFIEIESADITGYVNDISIRSTTLTTLDGDIVTIPNGQLNEEIITNLSTPQPTRRLHLPVGVSYEANPAEVKSVFHNVVEKEGLVLNQPEPRVHLREFGDSAVIFELLVWIDQPRKKRVIEDRLNTAIYDALAAADIDIPYPQRDVRISTADDSPGRDTDLVDNEEESD